MSDQLRRKPAFVREQQSMRPLDSKHRLQGFSLPDIVIPFNGFAQMVGIRHKLFGRRLKPGPMLNALVLEFMAMPQSQQDEILRKGVQRLEKVMNSPLPDEYLPYDGDAASDLGVDDNEAKGKLKA